MNVTLTGFNGEFIRQTEIPASAMWIERPVATVNPEIGFDEDSAIMRIPGLNDLGPEPWTITVERYMHIGDGIYRRVR